MPSSLMAVRAELDGSSYALIAKQIASHHLCVLSSLKARMHAPAIAEAGLMKA